MSKVKIVTSRKSTWGTKVIMAFDGLMEISSEGVLEVSEECAAHVTKGIPEWSYEGDEPAISEAEEVKEEEDNQEEDNEDSVDLSKMKMDGLKAICVEAQLPEEDWKSIKKKTDLIAYIEGKLN